MTPEKVKALARSRATEHVSDVDRSWVFSPDTGDLKHVRFRSDYTGFNVGWRRVWRTFGPGMWGPRTRLEKQIYRTWWEKAGHPWIHIKVFLPKDTNLPDGQVNGNLTFWFEKGQYITLFGPSVGVKVLDFLDAEPDNPHARAILDEMVILANLMKEKDE